MAKSIVQEAGGEKDKMYAVKVEDLTNSDNPQLERESRSYKVLEGGEGIPGSYLFTKLGNKAPSKAILVMDML